MKAKKTILTLTALFGSAALALAEGGNKTLGDGTLPEFLVEFDVNEDGMLDEEERQAAKDARKERAEGLRAKLDANGDGEISDEERDAARDAHRTRIEERRAARFAEADTDDSGDLSLEEFSAIGAIARLEERREGAAERIFNFLDKNHSGSISLEEFSSHLRHRRHHRGDGEGGGDDAEGGGDDA